MESSTPVWCFLKRTKVRIAETLDKLGVERIEAGMPASSEKDFEATKEIVKRVKAKVVAFCRDMKTDVDLALEAGAWGVVVELPSNERLIKKGYLWEQKDVIEKAVATCNYAKSNGLHTTFFLIDSSGSEPEWLRPIVQETVSRADIDSIVAVDTFGRLNPAGTKLFVQRMKERVDIPVEIHDHNDFGLAVANSLAAVEAGAEVVHTTMLRIGERSGGAATEEIAVGLKFLYGLDPGLNLERLVETAKIIQEISGIPLPGHKPVVGENSFSYEAGGVSLDMGSAREVREEGARLLQIKCCQSLLVQEMVQGDRELLYRTRIIKIETYLIGQKGKSKIF